MLGQGWGFLAVFILPEISGGRIRFNIGRLRCHDQQNFQRFRPIRLASALAAFDVPSLPCYIGRVSNACSKIHSFRMPIR